MRRRRGTAIVSRGGHLFAGHDLVCVRGERLVFAGVGFTVAPGGALLLVGPNGSGKSSLLRMMAGLLPPAEGRLTWADADLGDEPEAHRARMLFIGHQDPIKPALTVLENLSFWTSYRGGRAGPRGESTGVESALAALGLAALADLPARFLSAGQRRRLNLARLAAIPASIWLLDEPTTALDAEAQAALVALMARHRAAGGLVVASSHGPIGIDAAATLDVGRFAGAREAAP